MSAVDSAMIISTTIVDGLGDKERSREIGEAINQADFPNPRAGPLWLRVRALGYVEVRLG